MSPIYISVCGYIAFVVFLLLSNGVNKVHERHGDGAEKKHWICVYDNGIERKRETGKIHFDNNNMCREHTYTGTHSRMFETKSLMICQC